ncbi:hypothetical protein GH714_039567 [Hevea brasiliensis]|uniref:Protein kinase domain-containing protein n=1 Tax=Hevea brasiliensis TaxID=3981 RepID=A0A6A6MX25_HEVBR|nr:hypothetical protein GH714_039567 [Hevea brasiliensis]
MTHLVLSCLLQLQKLLKLHQSNFAPHTENSTSTSKPSYADTQTINEGLAQLEKYKEFAEAVSQTNKRLSGSDNVLDRESVLMGDYDTDYTTGNNVNLNEEMGEAGSGHSAVRQVTAVMPQKDPASNLSEPKRVETTGKDFTSNNNLGHSQPFSGTESSTKDVSKRITPVGVPVAKQVDISIDINDRFPRDFISEIFSGGISTEDTSVVNPIHKDGAGVSVNMENHEPKRWSYFQKLAQDGFAQKDAARTNLDHLGTPSAPAKVEEGDKNSYHFTTLTTDGMLIDHEYSQNNFGEDVKKNLPGMVGADSTMLSGFVHSPVKNSETLQFDAMMDNLKSPESCYEGAKLENRSAGLPPLDPSLVDFDINTVQVIKNDDLEELRELGSGTFGTVYHGKWRGSDVAIKRLKKICFTGRSSEEERLTLEFWREAEILSKLHHPNVVAFYGVVQDGPGGTLATVTEYMVDGSLRHVLLKKDRYLDRRKRLLIAMDAAFGMEYLHSKNIVHFDLKCDNLLVNLKDPQRPICKVGDFGLSKIKRNTLVSGGVRGTLPWMAPELLNGSSNKVSEKILTGEEPYANMHYGAIIGGIVNNTLRPTIPSFCDPEWKRLMEQCWAPNPAARPSFTEIAGRLMSTAAAQTKGHNNKTSKEPGREGFHPASQAFLLDPTSGRSTNVRLPDLNVSEVKPVLNYSIQTGEEFALEFMRDRVNHKKPLIPSMLSDPNHAPSYMELKERSNHGSVYSVPQTSSECESQEFVHGFTSSMASNRASTKTKVLCSFGGTILPRPSDGKFRYVGGETRIIRISKENSWEELKQKTLAIYDQAHVIKYQLPGEDLDALVSVSCDEDLHNMMEEWNEVEGRQESQKLRMFLFSMSDLEDAQFNLGSLEGDYEIQYVVAVNGMDLGSRKNSIVHGLAGSSGNNLSELDGLNIDGEMSSVAAVSVGVSTSPLTSTFQSAQPVLQNFSSAHETHLQCYHGQMMDHREAQQFLAHYPHDSSKYSPSEEIPYSTSLQGLMNQQGGLNGGNSCGSHHGQNSQTLVKEVKRKPDGSVQHEVGNEKTRPLEKAVPVNKISVAVAAQEDLHSLPSKNEGKRHESENVSSSVDAFNQVQISKLCEDDHCSPSSSTFGMSGADSVSNLIDFSYYEPSVPPQRVYYSERIPREQAEQMNSNLDLHTEHPMPTAKPLHIDPQQINDGLAQLQKYKEFADAVSQMNKTLLDSQDVLQSGFKLAVANDVDNKDSANRDAMLKADHDHTAEPKLSEITGKDFASNNLGHSQLFSWTESSTDDILKAGVSPMHKEAGMSVIMENHEPKHWSYFQKLAQEEFVLKDVSLIDQDPLGTPPLLAKLKDGDQKSHLFAPLTEDGVSMGHKYSQSQLNFGKDSNNKKIPGMGGAESTVHSNFGHSQVKGSESIQFGAMMENLKSPESQYEGGKLENRNIGLPPIDISLVDFDINTLQMDLATLATVTEFMVDGSLRHVLLKKDRYLDRRKRLLIAMDAAFGMEYLHSKNIVHFDLKCDNLLVNLKDPQRPICKVGDFGLSKIKRNTLVSGGVRGTLPWMAPELLNGGSNKVSEKVKVSVFKLNFRNGTRNEIIFQLVLTFFFGIVLWEILTGEEPYANMHYGAIIGGIVNNTLRPAIPNFCDPDWKRLMEQCWALILQPGLPSQKLLDVCA